MGFGALTRSGLFLNFCFPVVAPTEKYSQSVLAHAAALPNSFLSNCLLKDYSGLRTWAIKPSETGHSCISSSPSFLPLCSVHCHCAKGVPAGAPPADSTPSVTTSKRHPAAEKESAHLVLLIFIK